MSSGDGDAESDLDDVSGGDRGVDAHADETSRKANQTAKDAAKALQELEHMFATDDAPTSTSLPPARLMSSGDRDAESDLDDVIGGDGVDAHADETSRKAKQTAKDAAKTLQELEHMLATDDASTSTSPPPAKEIPKDYVRDDQGDVAQVLEWELQTGLPGDHVFYQCQLGKLARHAIYCGADEMFEFFSERTGRVQKRVCSAKEFSKRGTHRTREGETRAVERSAATRFKIYKLIYKAKPRHEIIDRTRALDKEWSLSTTPENVAFWCRTDDWGRAAKESKKLELLVKGGFVTILAGTMGLGIAAGQTLFKDDKMQSHSERKCRKAGRRMGAVGALIASGGSLMAAATVTTVTAAAAVVAAPIAIGVGAAAAAYKVKEHKDSKREDASDKLGHCPWCKKNTKHTMAAFNIVGRDKYKCEECRNGTLRCIHKDCTGLAKVRTFVDDFYCSMHR